MPERLLQLQEGLRLGIARGITSVCSAHPLVLRAGLEQAKEGGTPFLVEATCNQVNQFGGYSGMTPSDFRDTVHALAKEVGLPLGQVLLGGDHLGPNPWRKDSAEVAMDKAGAMVEAFVAAGFQKIHLDASMRCAGDPDPLPDNLIAERAAFLVQRAERDAVGPRPVYVIGTEVPPPGGSGSNDAGLNPTSPLDVERTLEVSETAFRQVGAEAAWERVIALVVQPGVEFGDSTVHAYDRDGARALSRAIAQRRPWMFEAHSTDYQHPQALRQLVEDRFAILKVGPWLTFACREALFALEDILQDLRLVDRTRPSSKLRELLDFSMRSNPNHWKEHHRGSTGEQALARLFSYSDRSRYYWNHPEVAAEVAFLLDATRDPIPLQLISQHLPLSMEAVLDGSIRNDGRSLVIHAIRRVLGHYAAACYPRTHAGAPS